MSKLIETNELSYRDIFPEDAAASGVNGRSFSFNDGFDVILFTFRSSTVRGKFITARESNLA